MQVSYCKPTVNDGKEWERDGCGCRATTVNRTLSRGSTLSKIAYFGGWKNSLLYDPRIVVNFATYTRVLYGIWFLKNYWQRLGHGDSTEAVNAICQGQTILLMKICSCLTCSHDDDSPSGVVKAQTAPATSSLTEIQHIFPFKSSPFW